LRGGKRAFLPSFDDLVKRRSGGVAESAQSDKRYNQYSWSNGEIEDY